MKLSRRRTAAPDVKHSESLAATIEISLASPMFQEPEPHARESLEVMAPLQQGFTGNIHRRYLTISDAPKILDEFYVLSLTRRKNGFITVSEPLRDNLRPILEPARL